MQQMIQKLINEKLAIPVMDGEDKRCTPQEAIQRYVQKNMTLHFAGVVGALAYELTRQFWEKNPAFTIAITGFGGNLIAMVKKGFTKKIMASFVGIGYPSPSPCKIIQNAYAAGDLEIECWTMRTIPQRLLAGALGWDFMPTNSLIGSSMEIDNHESFQTMEAPFSKNGRIGLLKALRPDITIAHGAMADPAGNTIMTYPLGGDAYGAWGAKKGVIVSVEKIVSTEYIRQHAHLVRIPADSVLAVCETPFGAHPGPVTPHGLPDLDSYFSDYDFMIDLAEATNDPGEWDKWVQKWVLDIKDHDDYLARLGTEHLLYLKGKSSPDAWISETMTEAATVDFDKEPNSVERLVLSAADVIADVCVKRGYKSMLAGIGLSNLGAWLATHNLKAAGHKMNLLAEIGMVGYQPRFSDPSVFSMHNNYSCTMLSNIETALGYNVGGATNQCLGVLGAGQIDVHGNANSTKITDTFYLVGSGGANDIATTNQETLVVMKSGKTRLVDKVHYVTYPGTKVKTLVTDVGVFEKVDNQDTFTLTAYLPAKDSDTEAECLAHIQERVGWELQVASNLKRIELIVEKDDLNMLRLYDPRGFFIG